MKRFRFFSPCFAAALIFIAAADADCSLACLSRTTRVTDAPERDNEVVRRGAVLVAGCISQELERQLPASQFGYFSEAPVWQNKHGEQIKNAASTGQRPGKLIDRPLGEADRNRDKSQQLNVTRWSADIFDKLTDIL